MVEALPVMETAEEGALARIIIITKDVIMQAAVTAAEAAIVVLAMSQ